MSKLNCAHLTVYTKQCTLKKDKGQNDKRTKEKKNKRTKGQMDKWKKGQMGKITKGLKGQEKGQRNKQKH